MKVSEAPAQTRGSGPYVGLRPFEEDERDLFFGRDRDARFVCDKVHSSRLTLLYAQSGTGKTSLLRAIVRSQLEQEDMLVISYDDWTGDRPLAELKDKICRVAEAEGVVDPGAGAPEIMDLVRLITIASGRTVALILDQFEELLIAQSPDTELVAKELGTLLRATDTDARVVLALREDFLAALEPFRYEIVNLFQTTHRLRFLTHEAVREAIVRPASARDFHGEYDPDVVDILIRDLTTEGPVSRAAVASAPADEDDDASNDVPGPGFEEEPPVDLPLLQLVCRELWERAEPKDGIKRIDLEVYEKSGGTEAIVDAYVRRVMPEQWAAQRDTARVLQFLCPPSGLKMAYTVDDLLHHCGFPPSRIEAVLKPLVASDILRVRQRGAVRYELRHDAFIRVLRPWMDAINHKLRVRKRLLRVGMAAVALLLVVGLPAAAMVYQKKESFHARTIGRLESLQKEATLPAQAELVFDDVFGFMLSGDPEGKRDEELSSLLQKYAPELPAGYGIYESGIEHVRFAKNRGYWPLSLEHSSGRNISRQHFQLHWNLLIQQFAERWGLPLPRAVRLKSRDDLSESELRLISPDVETGEPGADQDHDVTVVLDAAPVESLPFIAEAELTDRSKRFLSAFTTETPGEWGPVPYLEDGAFRSVPRWSLPVWTVSGSRAYDGAGALVELVGEQILENANLVLMPAVADQLLAHVAEIHPVVVREAQTARGKDIPSDLAELVKRGRSIKDLRKVLDGLANYPDGDSAAVAEQLDGALDQKVPPIATRARGPWNQLGKRQAADTGSEQPEDPPALLGAYEESFYWLSGRKLPIRIYLGTDVEAEVMRDRRASDEIRNAVSAARRTFTERFGVRLPLVRLYEHDDLGASGLEADQLRVELLMESSSHPAAAPVSVPAGQALQTILETLDRRATAFRVHWLHPDEVERLRVHQLSASTRSWIDERYSLTDLKHLMQRVIAPEGRGADALPEGTLAYLDWLLRSLVFWAEVDDARDLESLGERLEETQGARLDPSSGTPSEGDVAGDVDIGIRELSLGNLPRAASAFARAVATDREAATAAFVSAYPATLESNIRARYQTSCGDAQPPTLTLEDQADFVAYAERSEDRALQEALRVCAVASMTGPQRELERRELQKKLEQAGGTVD
ncbi:MAG: ATP-binding protein [Deltaproteobacteria bacterium]|nr:ATP-binding protein [Deltaproteobacteria bacterium]MBW2585366.1 ATP-binding protein [Deltaproteobacteria bacterium]